MKTAGHLTKMMGSLEEDTSGLNYEDGLVWKNASSRPWESRDVLRKGLPPTFLFFSDGIDDWTPHSYGFLGTLSDGFVHARHLFFQVYVPFSAMKLHDLLVSAIMPFFFVNPEHICAIERLLHFPLEKWKFSSHLCLEQWKIMVVWVGRDIAPGRFLWGLIRHYWMWVPFFHFHPDPWGKIPILTHISHTIHVWYIYLHLPYFFH